ncbi:M15 family metallopeptidase [Candidatus Berkiella aquae]|uniref:D-alanyl-D-alanine dipeptidase n=1 Tax=Candidatus Berkiella aquae TaxID=295108 RepID=A0A0Q9YMM7_9GAMM|nr:M15 family metallopeptidase [Candidatus Berkiella aquae]MCS5710635.1 M15 family metallopeptidase [Candidatus Berkiella aquae]
MKTLLLTLSLLTVFNVHAEEKIVLIADPEILAIPIQENNDPLINLVDQKEITYGPAPIDPNNTDYTKMRKTVYEKLKQAQKTLPNGLKFCLYEGYRSLDLQQKIFDERYQLLHKANPKMTHEELFRESTKFVSPVVNLDGSKNVPPHSTGAAIDVYLVDSQGKIVDMGITLDDTYQDLTGEFCKTNSNVISQQAKENRKIMNTALEGVGFVNYPTEYWHWSYGDRYWAHHAKQKQAINHAIKQS